ncbi:hypothetical protein AAG906_017945 [Vitis piasezkii]
MVNCFQSELIQSMRSDEVTLDLLLIGITQQHLYVNCGTQRSDKVEYNYGSGKARNSHNSCYNSGKTLKDERVSMATTSTRNGSLTS